MATNKEMGLEQQDQVLKANRDFIVKRLDTDEVMYELIQANLIGHNAAQRVQMMGMDRVDKNRIIIDQLITCGPGSLKKFCDILKRKEKQLFIAEQLEKCKRILYILTTTYIGYVGCSYVIANWFTDLLLWKLCGLALGLATARM